MRLSIIKARFDYTFFHQTGLTRQICSFIFCGSLKTSAHSGTRVRFGNMHILVLWLTRVLMFIPNIWFALCDCAFKAFGSLYSIVRSKILVSFTIFGLSRLGGSLLTFGLSTLRARSVGCASIALYGSLC